jgi:hypothetical protein
MRIASDLTNPAWGSQGLIKDRPNFGSVLQVRSWHSHGAHLGGFSFCLSFHGESWKGKVLNGEITGNQCLFYSVYSVWYNVPVRTDETGTRKKGAIINSHRLNRRGNRVKSGVGLGNIILVSGLECPGGQ